MATEKPLTIQEFARMGGKARARKLTKEQLRASAIKAVEARWAKSREGIKQDIKRAKEINSDLKSLAKTAKAKARKKAREKRKEQ